MPTIKLNTFQRMILMILVLFIPIYAFYSYTTEDSIDVIQDELIKASISKMELFIFQLDSSIEKLELASAPLLVDTNVLEYQYNLSLSDYSMLKTQMLIEEKLSHASGSNNWRNYVTVFFPKKNAVSSSLSSFKYDPMQFSEQFTLQWKYVSDPNMGLGFVRYYVQEGNSPDKPESHDVVLGMGLYRWGFVNLLEAYKLGNSGDPFFYQSGEAFITTEDYDEEKVDYITAELRSKDGMGELGESGHLIRSIADDKYLITFYKSEILDCYLVDYFPLDQVVQPLEVQKGRLGAMLGLLIILGIVAAFFLYRTVQIPIFQLVRGVQRIKRGDYSYRISKNSTNEFSFLMKNFNEMAEQIQDLVVNVLHARIHARDAKLKQLQAQIHPHFLYNSLGFIINMTKLGNSKAVIDMSHHLADYYRYSTQMDNQGVTLKDELAFVTLYLEIHRLRMDSLHYSIELPEEFEAVNVPRLLVQPLIENALVHGLEKVVHPGQISIRVFRREERIYIAVEDNGSGMTPEEVARLRSTLRLPAEDYKGCGLWNVYQRMLHHFGADAELDIAASPLGGLKVTMQWNLTAEGRDPNV